MSQQPESPNTVSPEPEVQDEQNDAVIGRALRWSLAVFLVLGVAGTGVAWWLSRPEPEPPERETELSLPELREEPSIEVPEMPFTDVTREAGIDFVHENGAAGDKLLPETMGGGCAFFDYDNDGDQDILFVNSRRWPWDVGQESGVRGQESEVSAQNSESRPDHQTTRPPNATMALYENDGTGHFTDVTAEAGLDVTFYGMGAAVGDYDNDGWRDVFFTAVGPNRLFKNVEGKFVDVTESAGVAGAEDAWGTSCGFFDCENDGDLDLFVCNYVEWSKEYDLGQNFQLTGGGRAYGRPQDFDGTYCYLYRNEGGGRFVDVSEEAGIQVDNPSTGEPLGKSLGVTFSDFDGDGLLDIVVSNDTVQNFLFHNEGNGRFREMAAIAGVAYDVDGNARGAMGIDSARFRNNDEIGIAIGNFSTEMTALYVARGRGLQFTDEAVPTGLGPNTRQELTFGVFYFDPDLNGRPDLFAANGHLEEDIHKVQESQHYEQPPQLFWNCGPEQPAEFVPVPTGKCGEDFTRPLVGRGAAFADVDADGDQDVLITTSGRRPRLLRNDQQLGGHWLRVKLIGFRCNRDALGARVEAHLPDRTLHRQVMPTRSYLSQVELPVTFGLGEAKTVEKLVVRWPDGSKQVIAGPEVNRLHVIEQETPQGTG